MKNAIASRSWGYCLLVAVFTAVAATDSARAVFFNIGSGFSASSNPTPDGVWRYGWSQTLTSTMTLYAQPGTSGVIQTWHDQTLGMSPRASHNPTNQLQGFWPPDAVGLDPGTNGQYSRARFTAPETNIYYIALEFAALDDATTDVHVIHNNSLPTLFSGEVVGAGSIQEYFPPGIVLAQGDTIDFVVGVGSNGTSTADTTGVFTTVTQGCLADATASGAVDVDDLLLIINSWGECQPKSLCPDLAPPGGNGVVNVDDLLVVINGWGPCD